MFFFWKGEGGGREFGIEENVSYFLTCFIII